MENRLRLAITPMLVATVRAGLASVAGVYPDHAARFLRALVFQHRTQTSKAPLVHLPFQGSALAGLRPLSNLRQVLNHYHTAKTHTLNDTTRHHMVTVRAKTGQATAKLFQVTLGAFCSFALQAALELEVSAFNVLPTFLAEEPIIGRDGGPRDTKVNAHNFPATRGFRFFERDYQMQKPLSLAIHKVGAVKARRLVHRFTRMVIQAKRDLLAPVNRRQRHDTIRANHAVASGIVANRATLGLRARHLFALFRKRHCRDYRLGCLDARRANQLRRQKRETLSKRGIGVFMQLHAVLDLLLPTVRRHRVEALRVLAKCFAKQSRLLFRRSQLQADSALHFSYARRFGESLRSKVVVPTTLFILPSDKLRGFQKVFL